VGLHVNSQLSLQNCCAQPLTSESPGNAAYHVTSYDALVHMVESGLGIGVLPRNIGRALRKRGLRLRLLSLDEPWTRRTLVVAVRSFSGLAPAPELLVNHLLSDPAKDVRPECALRTHIAIRLASRPFPRGAKLVLIDLEAPLETAKMVSGEPLVLTGDVFPAGLLARLRKGR